MSSSKKRTRGADRVVAKAPASIRRGSSRAVSSASHYKCRLIDFYREVLVELAETCSHSLDELADLAAASRDQLEKAGIEVTLREVLVIVAIRTEGHSEPRDCEPAFDGAEIVLGSGTG
jgi:hypothetical protein